MTTNTIDKYIRYFYWVLFVTFVIKLILSAVIPLTGDEAYYWIWGKFPAWGYYDHPPFIGWFLHPFVLISQNKIWLRLPVVLTTTFMGWLTFLLLRSYDPIKAALIAILFLISPLPLGAVLITTDTPVILFSFLSALCVFHAIRHNDRWGWYALGGLFLGIAFLSKYFAVLLTLAYLVYLLGVAPNRKRVLGAGLLLLGVLPFGLENLYWNYTHAWANILFNVYNRNAGDYFSIQTVLFFVVTVFYIFTPPICYHIFKQRKHFFKKHQPEEFYFLTYLVTVPIACFLLISTFSTIGLHWPLSFVPFAYLWLAVSASVVQIKKMLKFMYGFTGLHLALIFIAAILPMTSIYSWPTSMQDKAKLVYFFEHKAVRDSLDQYNQKYIFTSLDYVQADMMFYDSGYYCPTFGIGSVHGREDDLMTNFKLLAHKNFLIFYTRPPHAGEYQAYFAQSSVHHFVYDDATFYYVLGKNFNYPAYRYHVLQDINNTYWQVPDYLPHAKSFFAVKYSF